MVEESEDMYTNQINLLDLPDELLLQIFCNLNDTTLLNATRVCKRLKSISFKKKYNDISDDKYFVLKVFCERLAEEQKLYEHSIILENKCAQSKSNFSATIQLK